MRRKKRTIIAGQKRQAGAVLFCLLGCSSAGNAQTSVLTPPAPYSTTPAAVQADLDERNGNVKSWLSGVALPSPADFLVWGPVYIRPHLDYSLTYGDGIQSTPGKSNKSLVQQFTPGVLFDIGSHWTVDYDPVLTYYSSKELHDSLAQSVSLTWGTSYEDWVLGLTQTYATSSDPLVETGTQTDTESYATGLTASYRFNSLMSIDASVNQSISSASGFSSSTSWSTLEYLNYQFFPRLTGSIGAGFGYDSVQDGPDMSHESLQLRLSWRAFNKLSFTVHGGGEDRQFINSGGLPDLISPTYGAVIEYNPFEFTSFNLTLDRSISPSITAGSQASEATTLSVGLNQRLLQRLSLTLGGTYTEVNYLNTLAGLNFSRTDTSYAFNSRLTLTVLRRVSLAATYSYSENMSTMSGFTFSSSQVGMDITYRY